jgi:hypothetical protein
MDLSYILVFAYLAIGVTNVIYLLTLRRNLIYSTRKYLKYNLGDHWITSYLATSMLGIIINLFLWPAPFIGKLLAKLLSKSFYEESKRETALAHLLGMAVYPSGEDILPGDIVTVGRAYFDKALADGSVPQEHVGEVSAYGKGETWQITRLATGEKRTDGKLVSFILMKPLVQANWVESSGEYPLTVNPDYLTFQQRHNVEELQAAMERVLVYPEGGKIMRGDIVTITGNTVDDKQLIEDNPFWKVIDVHVIPEKERTLIRPVIEPIGQSKLTENKNFYGLAVRPKAMTLVNR